MGTCISHCERISLGFCVDDSNTPDETQKESPEVKITFSTRAEALEAAGSVGKPIFTIGDYELETISQTSGSHESNRSSDSTSSAKNDQDPDYNSTSGDENDSSITEYDVVSDTEICHYVDENGAEITVGKE